MSIRRVEEDPGFYPTGCRENQPVPREDKRKDANSACSVEGALFNGPCESPGEAVVAKM